MSELKSSFVAAFPLSDASTDARRRASEAARDFDLRNQRREHVRLRMRLGIAVGITSVAVIVTMTLFPSFSAAAYLRHVRQVISDAHSAHMTMWGVRSDGTRKKSSETWYQEGKWRIESAALGDVTISDGERKWVYSPDRKAVRLSRDGRTLIDHMSGFTLNSMVADAGGRSRLSIKDEGALKRLTIENPIDNAVTTLWFDKTSDLPVRGHVESKTARGMQLNAMLECDFNRPLPDTLFAPHFPPGTKIVDESEGLSYWQRALSKTVSAHNLDLFETQVKVVVRDLQATERGDIFMIYTGRADKGVFALTDDHGNVYVPCDGFQPQAYVLNAETGGTQPQKGISVDGRPLNGGWWTPLRTQSTAWHPLTLTFVATEVYYVVDPEKAKRWPKTKKMVSASEMTKVRRQVGKWTEHISESTCPLFPDYMPYMGSGPSNEFDVDHAEADARAAYLYSHGLYAEAEPFQREEIRLIDNFENRTGQRWVQSQSFYRMYLILKNQGRIPEARQWLRKILDEPNGANHDEQIVKALREEGLD